MRFFGFSQCLSIGTVIRRNIPVTRQMRVSDNMRYINVKVHDNQCFFSEIRTRAAFWQMSLNSSRQQCLPHPLLRLVRSTRVMCLAIVTETLLYCRPLLTHFAVAKHDCGRIWHQNWVRFGFRFRDIIHVYYRSSFLVAETIRLCSV